MTGAKAAALTTVVGIQYLRAIAATMVVLQHARKPRPWLFDPWDRVQLLNAGVDIFFVISGYIMYVFARNISVGEFTRRRIIRIVPLYWLVTIAILAMNIAARHVVISGKLLRHLILSFLFVPQYDFQGMIWPYLVPGWTLNYEMFFYCVFAVGLLFRRTMPVVLVTLLFCVLLEVVIHPTHAVFICYTDPRLLEFVAGMVLGWLGDRTSPRGWWPLLLLGTALIASSMLMPLPFYVVFGIPAALIVAGTLAIEQGGRMPASNGSKRIGDASYAIYLVHPLILAQVDRLTPRLPLAGYPQFAFHVAAGLTASVALGLLVHMLIKRPMLRRLHVRWSQAKLETSKATN